MFDKRALAMGEPTSISQRGEVQSDDLKVETINRFFEELPRLKPVEIGATIDSPSTDDGTKAKQTDGKPALDATLDASPSRPGAGSGPGDGLPSTRPDAERLAASAGAPGVQAGPGGRGGAAAAAAD